MSTELDWLMGITLGVGVISLILIVILEIRRK